MVQLNRSKKDIPWKLVNPVGRVIKLGTHSDCWLKLLAVQPRSAYHATTQDGWKISRSQGGRAKRCKEENCGKISIYNECLKKCECMDDKH